MKIAFITNVPSPYRVDFFNEFGKHCDLTVFFEKECSDERDKSWGGKSFHHFTGIFLKGIKSDVDKAVSFEICRYLSRNSYDHVVVSNIGTPTGVIAVLYLKLKKVSYWLEGDGGFAKNGKGLKERLKRFLIKGAKGCFSTSCEHDNYYRTYGVPQKRVFRYPFTALYERDIREKIFTEEEKYEVRQQLGITESRYILTVGQFIHRKGFDVLLHAAPKLPKNVGIYLIGGTPTEEYLILKNDAQLDNVHFVPFTDKETLKKWYGAAELMVFPTREDIWGLVVNEAMAAGLPVVTTNRCIAGLELVNDGENGYIVPVEDIDALAEKINAILGDAQLQQTMADNSLKRIRPYTIENMAKVHAEIFEKEQDVF